MKTRVCSLLLCPVLVCLAEGGTANFQQAYFYPTQVPPINLAAGDLNGDGKIDLLAVSPPQQMTAYLGDGSGGFKALAPVTFPQISTPTSYPNSVVIGDFNHDGKADAAVADPGSNVVWVLLGNGDGTFAAPVSYQAGPAPWSLAAADLNKDGNLDLAVVNNLRQQEYSGVSILIGKGDGTFASGVTLSAGTTPRSIVSADFNGDGKPDLAVADAGDNGGSINGSVIILLGNGDGTFSQASYAVGNYPISLAVGDLNRDGKPDLAVTTTASDFTQSVAVLLGNGNGRFQNPVLYPTIFGGLANITVMDANGDGVSDVVVSTCCGDPSLSPMGFFQGNGDGTLQTGTSFSGGTSPQGFVAADFNHDGLQDLAITNTGVQGGSGGIGLNILLQSGSTSSNPKVTVVSAASFLGGSMAPNSIASAFGADLGVKPAQASSVPLPTSLGGTTVSITDAGGNKYNSELFYASKGQVNFLVPSGASAGNGTITVTSGDGTVSSGSISIASVTPGIFTVNSSGLVAGYAVLVAGSTQTTEQIFQVVNGAVEAKSISLGSSSDQTVLVLFGTGLRNAPAGSVHVTFNGTPGTVEFAGAQSGFVGLDQINVVIPQNAGLHGTVTIAVTAGGQAANNVNLSIE